MRHGADVLEIDVRLSSDNEVMVFHDETLERTTNGTGLVREHTEATLKQLDAAYYFSLDGQLAARGSSTENWHESVGSKTLLFSLCHGSVVRGQAHSRVVSGAGELLLAAAIGAAIYSFHSSWWWRDQLLDD